MKIIQLFLTVEWLIIQELIKRLKHDGEQSFEEYVEEREGKSGDLNRFLVVLFARYQRPIEEAVKQFAKQSQETILQHVDSQWGNDESGTPNYDDVVSKIVQKTFEVLNRDVILALLGSNGIVRRLYDEIIDAIREQQDAVSDDLAVINGIIQNVVENGLNSGFVDKNGRIWKVRSVLPVIVRHLMNDVYSEVELRELARMRIELVRVGSFSNPREACAKLQASGIICIVPRNEASEHALQYPNIWDSEHAYLEAGGHRGINCRHAWLSMLEDKEIVLDIFAEVDTIRRSSEVRRKWLNKRVKKELED
ncbi:phage minor capsid protein [Aerococcaceae bacterium NML190073]|nr:phage minor capsid protein [Aerococcaceae bacterium NML190073]